MNENQDKLKRANCRLLTAPTLHQLWIGVPFFLLLLKAFLFPLPLLDFWWHLKMGQVILRTMSIPRVDLFSFTAAGKVFIVQNWLAEVLFYLIYKAGGVPLLVFMNAALLACVLIPIYRACLRVTNSFWAAVFSTCMVAICLPCNMRPQVFSYLLFAVFYALLLSYCSDGKNRIWFLPVLMVLWVNLHGAFVMGLALFALVLCSEGVRSLSSGFRQGTLSRKKLANLALILLLSVIATLANPEAYKVYAYIYTVISDPSSQQLVMEWQPPSITSVLGIVQFYLPFFLAALILIKANERPRLTDAALCAAFAFFGMTATRNAAWFLLISGPILARYLPQVNWGFAIAVIRRACRAGFAYARHIVSATRENYPLNFAIALVFLLVTVVQSPWLAGHFHRESLLDPLTPVGAMDYIQRESLTGNIFHPQIFGDYLIWRLWPRQRSFFDGRVHLFGMPFMRDYQRIYSDSHGEELLGKYKIRFLLLSKSDRRSESMSMIDRVRKSQDWKLLYEDKISILFEKTTRVDP